MLHTDYHVYRGHLWQRTDVDIPAAGAQGPARIHFPGLFSETWLYVNGNLVAHRPQNGMWWKNSYAFNWDVDITGHLKPGKNTIAIRVWVPHHVGGLFRRPFIYRPIAAAD